MAEPPTAESGSADSEPGIGGPSAQARFESAEWPSGPRWITLLPMVLGVVVFMLSAWAIFVFAVGVALAFLLVPVVS